MGAAGAVGGFGMLLGTMADFFGTLRAGEEEYQSLEAQRATALLEGKEARTLTRYKVRLIHEAGQEFTSTLEAETGKSGLAMTGTPLLGLVHSARQIELSAALERRGGQVTEMRYQVQADQLHKDAQRAKRAAKREATGGLFKHIGGMASSGAFTKK